MPRKPRIEIAGYYHIINRGVEQRVVFKEASDYALNSGITLIDISLPNIDSNPLLRASPLSELPVQIGKWCIVMQFVVIGEIITRLDSSYKTEHPQIPWQKIKNFRNIIAHDYFGIDADEIWDIINHKLIPLKDEIEKLLEDL